MTRISAPHENIKWGDDLTKDENLKQNAIDALAAFRHEINLYPNIDYLTLLHSHNQSIMTSSIEKKSSTKSNSKTEATISHTSTAMSNSIDVNTATF